MGVRDDEIIGCWAVAEKCVDGKGSKVINKKVDMSWIMMIFIVNIIQ